MHMHFPARRCLIIVWLGMLALSTAYAGMTPEEVKLFEGDRLDAEKGNARGQYNLGTCYASGTGVKQNEAEALKWFLKAADQGYSFAQCNLGIYYANGIGVTRDQVEAAKWLRKAAEQGDAPAQYNLGRMYILGKGDDKNFLEARFWIKQALENNDEYIGALAQQVWDDYKLGTY